ncbi:MAG TPA: cbb3-type cytochrome c oxidase subunit I [Acidimicrobiales bacterium]|nr:cbb3-type cytochrome c oxidase subunit I [Acidimicrobiales bacterium]
MALTSVTITETRPEEAAPAPPPGAAAAAAPEGWFATADHKRLGLLYLAGALVFLVVGGAVGMVLRAELLSEGSGVAGDEFRRLFSMHVTVSTMLFLAPAWVGLATYLVPLQIGSGRLAFARLHAFSFWLFLLGGGLLIASYVVGPPEGLGLVSSVPTAAGEGGANEATTLMIASLALVAVSSLLAALDLAVTVLKLRTPGMTLRRLPMFSWAIVTSSLVTLLATPVFIAGLVLFYLDQRVGGTFFATATVGSRSIWRHTLWLYGRPDIYLLVLPGLGAACDIVSTHARRPLLSASAARGAIAAFGFLSLGSWAAGSGVGDAIVMPTYSPLTALVVVPVGALVLLWLGTMAAGRRHLHSSLLFVAGFILLAAFGALNAIIAAAAKVDGTAWTSGHLHVVAFGAPTLLLLGAITHWAPKMFGRELAAGPARIGFLGVFGGFFLLGLGSYLLGYDGAPSGVRDFDFSSDTSTFSTLSALGAVVLLLGLLGFLAEVVRAARSTGSPGPADPYEGLTLEWATSSPPPPHSFDSVPEVRSATPLLDLRLAEGADAGGDG